MSETRKIRKGKLVLVGIAVIAVIAIVVAIIFAVKNSDKDDIASGDKTGTREETVVYDLPDITYSEMEVTNIEMEYLKDNNETMVSLIINNTTENTVSQETLTAYLINKDGETLGQTRTYIDTLAPGQQYSISVILKGDLTATTQIKLQK